MWLVFAVLASVFWGMSYAISEQIYRHISIYTVMAMDCLILAIGFLIAAFINGVVGTDLRILSTSPKVFWLFVFGVIVFGIAELCIALSITSKSATLAGLIEISYPLFIALFAYIFFKESQVNLGIAMGAALIFCGVAVVYWFSR
jgi:drug/metabolite transporter (DMT)-like permease